MIRYSLKCAEGHQFDGWFKSAAAFDDLARGEHLSCAVCGISAVAKAVMAPGIAVSDAPAQAPAPKGEAPDLQAALRAFKTYVERNSTYVGGKFAQEARQMHLGEAPERMIHGEARPEEARALIEDGIAIAPLPFIPKSRAH